MSITNNTINWAEPPSKELPPLWPTDAQRRRLRKKERNMKPPTTSQETHTPATPTARDPGAHPVRPAAGLSAAAPRPATAPDPSAHPPADPDPANPPFQESPNPPPATPEVPSPTAPPLHPSTTPLSPRTRTGKIARLPHAIREQVNTRLQDGEPADDLVEWLNSLPEVQSVLNDHFNGSPINKGNFHEWKRGGYRDWKANQDALDMAERFIDEDAPACQTAAAGLIDKLVRWLAIQFAAATQNLDPESPEATARLAAFYQLAAGISRFRRDNLNADRTQIQREWLALERENADFLREKLFWAWTERPDIQEKLFPTKGLTPETLAKIEKELNLL